MEPSLRSVTWEAPEHHHVEKGNDWFFALAIVVVALVIVAIIIGNLVLSVLIGVAGSVLALAAAKRPSIIPYAVTVRGVRIDTNIYPFPTLESYYIDEEDPRGPQLLLRSDRRFMPLIVMPIPADHVDDIESILETRLEEEHLEEPFLVKVLELFGF